MIVARAGSRAGRVLRAVDESEQIALVEVAEAVHLVDDLRNAVQPVVDQAGQLEAQVHPGRADVEQQVAGSADGVAVPGPQLPERVQPGWPRPPGQPVPGGGPDSGDAAQVPGQVPEADGFDQPCHVGAQLPGGVGAVGLRVDDGDQEDRGLRQRRDDRLRLRYFSRFGGLGGRYGLQGRDPCLPR